MVNSPWSRSEPSHSNNLATGKIPSWSRLGAGSTISCLLSLSDPASAAQCPLPQPGSLPPSWLAAFPGVSPWTAEFTPELPGVPVDYTQKGLNRIGTLCLGAGLGLLPTPSFFLSSLDF